MLTPRQPVEALRGRDATAGDQGIAANRVVQREHLQRGAGDQGAAAADAPPSPPSVTSSTEDVEKLKSTAPATVPAAKKPALGQNAAVALLSICFTGATILPRALLRA